MYLLSKVKWWTYGGPSGLPFKSLGFGEDGQAKAKGWGPSSKREERIDNVKGYLSHICCKWHTLHQIYATADFKK